ncbi:MAG: iron uptake porin [Oscillatoriales cyanobacterium RM2_1_1]|nr:iron uptake porin [Oscillatoriales cyanobacterium SM2_3_0]NJO47060.1 iron uptake porin [Oscillatoriales cyanobacterium RM2_1_1]
MKQQLLKAWLLSPAILGTSLILSSSAMAENLVIPETESSVIESSVLDRSVTESSVAEGSIPEPSTSTVTVSEVLTQVPVNPQGSSFGPQSVDSSSGSQPAVAEIEGANSAVEDSQNQFNQYSREGRGAGTKKQSQVTSVSQLSDVQPTDWAFQALQSLVERYGCIAGYPDGTYKGNRALTRFEFAAGVNACLERITELIDASTSNLVTREDLAKLQRLMEEFAAEIAALRGRVTVLEARTAELEANQFSTTTKLNAEVIFFAGDTFGDRATYNVNGDQGPDGTGLVDDDDDPTQTFLGYRARLNFDTSFTGEDLLRTRLEVSDIPNLSEVDSTNTLMTRLSTDGGDGTFILDDLYYRFPIGGGQLFIGANSLDNDDLNDILNPLESTGAGTSSRFGRYNPLIARGPEGVGAIFKYDFDFALVSIGYLSGDGANANDGRGLFNGSYSTGAQVIFNPLDDVAISVEYSHRYFREDNVSVTGSTGSFIADRPFGNSATSSDNLGAQANWGITDWFQLGGWFGVAWANQQDSNVDREATILNWAVTLAFPDVLKEGDLGGILVGMPPKVVEHDVSNLEDEDTSIHIEAFYRFQLSEYIAVTPGFFIVTSPDHNSENDTIFVGTLRTQFRF